MAKISSLIHEIEDATVSRSPEKRLQALTRIAGLFTAGSHHYSKEQIELFDDLFERLVAAIEVKARAKLARYLSAIPDAPAALIRTLAFDDSIAVAAPVLSRSTLLSDSDLIANASTKSQDHLHAIAQRRTISEAITEILVDRGERRVVHTVAKNPGARISDGSFGKLVVWAGGDDALAQYVGMRRDIPRHHFLKLLEVASASVRAKLEQANPEAADRVQDVVTEVADNISLEVRNNSPGHIKAKARVKLLHTWNDLSEADVHASARSQNFEKTAVALSILGRFPIELAERALLDDNPDTVLIIAKAAGCSWATVKAILLMTAADRRMSEMDLGQARENFERLKIKTAKRVLEFYAARRKVGTIVSQPIVAGASLASGALAS